MEKKHIYLSPSVTILPLCLSEPLNAGSGDDLGLEEIPVDNSGEIGVGGEFDPDTDTQLANHTSLWEVE